MDPPWSHQQLLLGREPVPLDRTLEGLECQHLKRVNDSSGGQRRLEEVSTEFERGSETDKEGLDDIWWVAVDRPQEGSRRGGWHARSPAHELTREDQDSGQAS